MKKHIVIPRIPSRSRLAFLSAIPLAATLMLVSCGGDSSPSSEDPSRSESTAAAPEAEPPDPNLPELTVTVTANDQMKFGQTEIVAKPGQKVTITLKNIGSMPKISMGHNLVVMRKEADVAAFLDASMTRMGNDYIAPDLVSEIIIHTKLLGPGEEDTISFAAPREPGNYEYICTFPGHYAIGMKGVLKVE